MKVSGMLLKLLNCKMVQKWVNKDHQMDFLSLQEGEWFTNYTVRA